MVNLKEYIGTVLLLYKSLLLMCNDCRFKYTVTKLTALQMHIRWK